MAHHLQQWRKAVTLADEYAACVDAEVVVEECDAEQITLAVPGRGSFTVGAWCLSDLHLLDREVAAGVAGCCQAMQMA